MWNESCSFAHSVIPEGASRLSCSFGTCGGFHVKVVVEVSHTESTLQEQGLILLLATKQQSKGWKSFKSAGINYLIPIQNYIKSQTD